MNSPREAQFSALLSLVASAQDSSGRPSFVTAARKFVQWEEVADSETPALFLTKGFEHASQERTYGETKWRVRALLWVYCLHSPADPNAIPGTLLNNLLDSVEAALAPPPYLDRQTLGGLVSHAYIDGEIVISEGMLPDDRISIAVVPVTLETGV